MQVIDELILVLGLDTRKFTEGQRVALESFKKGKDAALDFGRNVEQVGNKMGEALSFAKRGALGLIGAFAGGEVATMIGHVVAMDAATGRMATSIGTGVQNLSLWEEMVKRVGGTAESARSSLGGLQNQLNQIKQHNAMPSDGLAALSNLAGFNLLDTNADEALRKSREWAQGQIGSGKRFKNSGEAATFLRDSLGIDQHMLDLLLDPQFGRIERDVRAQGGATPQSVKEAQELVEKTAALTNAFDNLARLTLPAVTSIMEVFTKAIGQDIKDVKSFFSYFGIGSASAKTSSPEVDDAKKRLADGLSNHVFSGGSGGGDYAAAISAVESGGNYKAVGPMTGRGDRAYGKYQIMGNNIGPWSEEALGRRVSIQEFMANPSIQDQIFKKKFDSYVAKYGASGASRAWLAGEGGMNDPSRQDAYGTNVLEYQRRFDKALGAQGTAKNRNDNQSSISHSSTEVHIGEMNVNAPNATDADGVGRDAVGAIKRQAMLNPLNTALV